MFWNITQYEWCCLGQFKQTIQVQQIPFLVKYIAVYVFSDSPFFFFFFYPKAVFFTYFPGGPQG
jgi:hypothetical protein